MEAILDTQLHGTVHMEKGEAVLVLEPGELDLLREVLECRSSYGPSLVASKFKGQLLRETESAIERREAQARPCYREPTNVWNGCNPWECKKCPKRPADEER